MKVIVAEDGRHLELSQLYVGVEVKTDIGTFSLVERDGGLWVSFKPHVTGGTAKGRMVFQLDINGMRAGDIDIPVKGPVD